MISLLPSFVIAYVIVGWVRRSAGRLGLLDKPGHRKVHTVPIPLGGGLGIWAGVVGTLVLGLLAVVILSVVPWLAYKFPNVVTENLDGLRSKIIEMSVLVGCGTVLMLLGLADDRRGIPWWLRLLVELGVASFCVYFQGLQLTAYIQTPWLTGLLSVLWIVALINSFNMLDNMDALSGGVAAICSSILAIMLLSSTHSGLQPQTFVAIMMLLLVGALLGFLCHNWPPAKIFMGDAGSYFIGYWIAVGTLLATYSGYQGGQSHAILAPLVILAIPLYDMISVILIRLREGRSPFEGDKSHFSHRLVDLGMTKKQAVLTIYLATAACAVSALILPRVDWIGAGLILLAVMLVLALIRVLESVGRSNILPPED
jgi:UDP-GlcNAc:undecaprenyl-phosphate GlcNAc-1-phosphate transferase